MHTRHERAGVGHEECPRLDLERELAPGAGGKVLKGGLDGHTHDGEVSRLVRKHTANLVAAAQVERRHRRQLVAEGEGEARHTLPDRRI